MAKTAGKNRLKAQTRQQQQQQPQVRQPAGIIEILAQEHAKVKTLFGRLFEHPDSSEEIFSRIYSDLEAHMRGEEQLFYPELEPEASLREKVLEAYEEHNLGKILLNELEGMSPGDERWMAKLQVLSEVISHHIGEEETDIFPEAKKVLGKEREAQIARQYLEEKPALEEVPEIGGEEEQEEF
jgi:hemerythrin superfamily protein